MSELSARSHKHSYKQKQHRSDHRAPSVLVKAALPKHTKTTAKTTHRECAEGEGPLVRSCCWHNTRSAAQTCCLLASANATHTKTQRMPAARPLAADGDGDDLQEALLGEDEQPSTSSRVPAQHHQQQLIHYQPFSVDTFIHWVLQSWAAFLSECGDYWQLTVLAVGCLLCLHRRIATRSGTPSSCPVCPFPFDRHTQQLLAGDPWWRHKPVVDTGNREGSQQRYHLLVGKLLACLRDNLCLTRCSCACVHL